MAKRKTKSAAAAKGAEPLGYIVESLRALAVPIDSVAADPRNARRHDAANLQAIANSLRRYGQRKPVIVNTETGTLEAGHGTVEAARSLGWTHVAAVYVKDDPTTAAGFALADNRSAELATWDDALLLELTAEIRAADPAAYDDLLIAALVAAPEAAAAGGSLKPVDLKPPPKMTWVLIGLPTVRFDEVADAMEVVANVPGILFETTSNDGYQNR